MIKLSSGDFLNLSPRQEDIYNEMLTENISTPEGKKVTPQWVKTNYPSTPIQPRKSKKTSSKTKRKIKKRK